VDPLVDPVTGELNQPMDSMNPAQRSAVMRDYGLKTQTPGMVGGRSARVLEQGLNNVPGSAGVMEDVNAAASGELRRSMQGVAQQFGSSKTLNEGGAAAQSAALARNDRAEGVIAKAYHAIPIADAAPASRSSTIAALQNLTGRFQSNQKLAEALNDPKLASVSRRLPERQYLVERPQGVPFGHRRDHWRYAVRREVQNKRPPRPLRRVVGGYANHGGADGAKGLTRVRAGQYAQPPE
jgi:propanediol dehydratase small subunit